MAVFSDTQITLTPVNSGEEHCDPKHFWGPGVRNNFVIHYVISGKGCFYCKGKEYSLKKGQLFIIFPDTVVKYIADSDEPWQYTWIVFEGDGDKILRPAGFSPENPVCTPENGKIILDLLLKMTEIKNLSLRNKLKYTSLLYEFSSELIKDDFTENKNENIYFNTAVNYINVHYSEDISIEKISSVIGISRKYLFAIFKNTLGISPRKYLLDFRMKKACELLADKKLTIANVAYSIGYKDPLTFSRMFKEKIGVSPTDFRRKV